MNKNLNTDKFFREKLDRFSAQPPPLVWENIKGQMAALRRKKRMMYIGWISAAAVVVFAFMAGWYFNERAGELTPVVVKQNTAQPILNENIENTVENEVAVTEFFDDEFSKNADQNLSNKLNEKTFVASNVNVEKLVEDKLLVASFERFTMNLMDRKDADFNKKESKTVLAQKTVSNNEKPFTILDENLIAENLKNLNPAKKSESIWKMGLNISPGYSSHVASHTETYSQNMNYNGENGNGDVGGGFSVQYKTGKKIRIESGIYYAQSGQKTSNSFELFAFKNDKYDAVFAPENNYDQMSASAPGFSNSINVSNGNMTMNSTAGVIELSATPKGAEIVSELDTYNSNRSNSLVSSGEFSQVFDFIEIPLYLRYSVVDSKIGVEVMGGLNAGIVVGNNAYIDNEYGLQNIGKTQGVSSVNFSGTVGIGLNYALGKHVSLAVEPRLNYYLNSISQNSSVNFRPYRIGIYTGLYYEF